MPILSGDTVAMPSLDPNYLTMADLASLCIRMHIIFDDMSPSEGDGRFMNAQLFQELDSLSSDLRFTKDEDFCVDEWLPLIDEFGRWFEINRFSTFHISPEELLSYKWMFDVHGVEYPFK